MREGTATSPIVLYRCTNATLCRLGKFSTQSTAWTKISDVSSYAVNVRETMLGDIVDCKLYVTTEI